MVIIEAIIIIGLIICCLRYKNLSERDQFTGIYHRHWFNQNLVSFMRRAKVRNKLLSLVLIDLDKFKELNDSMGHVFGDTVILLFVAVIQSILKEEGYNNIKLARYGGDEFALIAFNIPICTISRILNRIQKRIGERCPITASIGGAVFDPRDKLNFMKFVDRADKALYEAKDERNNFIWR